jgi:hypothetical protein
VLDCWGGEDAGLGCAKGRGVDYLAGEGGAGRELRVVWGGGEAACYYKFWCRDHGFIVVVFARDKSLPLELLDIFDVEIKFDSFV